MNDVPRQPQYGEYATPEQQRAAIKDPEKNPHFTPPEPDPDPASDLPTPSYPVSSAQPGPKQEERAGAFLRHPTDRVITIALLVVGLYSVISAITGRSTIAAVFNAAYHGMGLSGDYTVTAMTAEVGDIVAIVFLALWLVGAVLAVWNIARGRISFWIPLAAGILAIAVRAAGYLMLLANDPTFVHYVQSIK